MNMVNFFLLLLDVGTAGFTNPYPELRIYPLQQYH